MDSYCLDMKGTSQLGGLIELKAFAISTSINAHVSERRADVLDRSTSAPASITTDQDNYLGIE